MITDIGDSTCKYSHDNGNEYPVYDWAVNITVNETMTALLDCYNCRNRYVIGTVTTCWRTHRGIRVGDWCCSQSSGLMITGIVCMSLGWIRYSMKKEYVALE